jgi:1,4-dihydroxy-2-naphthoyl-CoA hydrolase
MAAIWFNKNTQVTHLQGLGNNTLGGHLGMEFLAIGDDFLQMRMPVDARTHQPYGLLHGGASVALAETVGSVASALVINPETHICVGLEINANHIKAVRSGFVVATAKPLQLGSGIHVWQIHITLENTETLVCTSRLTVAILPKKNKEIGS